MSENKKTITFELATEPEDRERVQTVDVVTDMTQSCSRCKVVVVAEPIGLAMVDAVDSKAMHDANWAVAMAMYVAFREFERDFRGYSVGDTPFDLLPYDVQSKWMKATGTDGWHIRTFNIENIGVGLSDAVRKAGVDEAKKWPAFTDRRKKFKVIHGQFPAGWVHIGFNQHSSKTGEPVENMTVGKYICPKCAPVIFDAACIDPCDPFGHGKI